jgi:NADH-quinone oxidoreductase subunit F
MESYLICNAVSPYEKANIGTDILKENTSQVLEAIASKGAITNYIILENEQHELKNKIEAEAKKLLGLNLKVILVDGSFRFVYGNASALLKVIEVEKPLPSNKEINENIFTVEEILNTELKRVIFDGAIKRKSTILLKKTISPREILSKASLIDDFKGMYFGHPMGLFVGEKDLDKEIEIKADYIFFFNEKDCILDRLKNIAERYTKESCGRCVFGFEGVTQINMILSDISLKKGKSSDISLLLDLCSEMRNQVLCEVDLSLATSVISAFECFKEEIEEHITKKSCKAGYCSKFVTYHILADKCIGCTECLEVCEDDAISGKKKFIHVIDQDECSQCGECIKVCEEEAIVKAGAIKPRCPSKPIPCKK